MAISNNKQSETLTRSTERRKKGKTQSMDTEQSFFPGLPDLVLNYIHFLRSSSAVIISRENGTSFDADE